MHNNFVAGYQSDHNTHLVGHPYNVLLKHYAYWTLTDSIRELKEFQPQTQWWSHTYSTLRPTLYSLLDRTENYVR